MAATAILVIEDEAPVANLLRDHLAARGFEVRLAADGQEGLLEFRARRPDAVLCDLLLPRRNGFRLVEDFAREAPGVPVIVMTGIYRSKAYQSDLASARAFLEKPLDLARLDAALDAALADRPARSKEADRMPAEPVARRRSDGWIPIQVLPLPSVLQALWRAGRTGLLTVRVGERRTLFLLQDGQVRFVRCNDPALRLERILLQLGRIHPDDLAAARRELGRRTVPVRLGDILVERGLLAPADLEAAIQVQLRKIIARAFDADGGETSFTADAVPANEDVRVDTDVRALIIAGCAACREDEWLAAHLPDPNCKLQLLADPEDPALKLPAGLRRLLLAITEPTPAAEVLAMAELLGLPGRPVVFGLTCAEVLAPCAPEAGWTEHRPAAWGDVVELPANAFLPATYLALAGRAATGTLNLAGGERQATIAFRDGRLVHASTNDARGRLGQRLLSAGLVTPEQLQTALEVQARQPRRPLGRILVEMGSLAPTQLLHAVRAQVLSAAREALLGDAWDDVTFQPGRAPDVELVPLGVTTADLVLDALRETPAARLELAAGLLARERPAMDLQALTSGRFTLTDTEERIARAMAPDSAAVLRSLTAADASDPDVLRLLVLGLLVTPAAQPVPAAASA